MVPTDVQHTDDDGRVDQDRDVSSFTHGLLVENDSMARQVDSPHHLCIIFPVTGHVLAASVRRQYEIA